MSRTALSRSPEETRILAAAFVRDLAVPAVVRLFGELGAGKTCFVQGMAEGLGWEGAVNSPTYTLVREYPTSPRLAHADLYRLTHPDEVRDLELEAFLEEPVILAVEWSGRVPGFWPETAWRVDLEALPEDADARKITFSGGTGDG